MSAWRVDCQVKTAGRHTIADYEELLRREGREPALREMLDERNALALGAEEASRLKR